MSAPYYLNAKATRLPEGHDDTLDAEPPVDAATRSVPPTLWPSVSTALGPIGPPDAPAGPRGVDPLRRSLAPFSWPGYVADYAGDLDPDLALWPGILLTRWPFTGPPTTGVWPLGYMGVDNTATIWVCTAGGQPGTWLPLGPGDTLGIVTPQAFGAVGDGVHDDTAAVLAAIAAASPGGTSPAWGQGGVLFWPPGHYKCTAALFYYPNTMWVGAGVSATYIQLTAELWDGVSGTPAHFISAAGGPSGPGFSQQTTWLMRDMMLIGPGFGMTLGQTNTHTSGIQGNGGSIMLQNVHIEAFYAGIEKIGNHDKFYNVYAPRNFYGIDYADNQLTSANEVFYACAFSSNNLAGIHVGGTNFIGNATISQMHLGFGPIGILKTDKQNGWDGNGNPVYSGGAATQPLVYLSTLSDISFEACGNGAILDMSTCAQATGPFRLINPWFSWANQYRTTIAPITNSDYQGAWPIILRNCNGGTLDISTFSVNPTYGVGIFKTTAGNSPAFNFLGNVPSNFFGSGTTWGQFGAGVVHSIWAGFNGFFNPPGSFGNMLQLTAVGVTINVGDLLEQLTGTVYRVQRATGTKPIFGVAMTPAPATGQGPIMVMVDGFCNATAAVNAIPAESPLYTDATNPYMVTNVTGGKLVGVATNGGTGTCMLRLRPGV